MCLLTVAFRCHPDYPLVLAANRDEFFERPTRALAPWPDAPEVLAGRDERGGGTWLGMTTSGRLAALTNYREALSPGPRTRSRGELTADFLRGGETPEAYLEKVRKRAGDYPGFNLIVGTGEGLFHYSNRGDGMRPLGSGLYGLSNHLLDTPWPKVERAKRAAARLLERGALPDPAPWLDWLSDRSRPPDEELPDTGVGLDWERLLSSVFIRGERYGTRSSTFLCVDAGGRARFTEKIHPVPGTGRGGVRTYRWQIPPPG